MAGFSFGGAVAAAVAAQLGLRIARLALIAPGGFGPPVGRTLDIRKVPFGGEDEAVRSALRHNLEQTMFADPSAIDDSTIELHRGNVLCARFDSRRVSLADNMLRDLPRIQCPILAVWGAEDNLAYPSVEERARLCCELAPGVRVEVVPGAGHWVQYEAAATVNSALIRFLKDDDFSLQAAKTGL